MNPNPRVRVVLLALAIVSCLLAIVAGEETGEVLALVATSWLAIALGFTAGALL